MRADASARAGRRRRLTMCGTFSSMAQLRDRVSAKCFARADETGSRCAGRWSPSKAGAAPATVSGWREPWATAGEGLAAGVSSEGKRSSREPGDRPDSRPKRGFVLRRVIRARRRWTAPSAPMGSSLEAVVDKALGGDPA